MSQLVKPEKYGIRNSSYGLRHRTWGSALKQIDLDSIEASSNNELRDPTSSDEPYVAQSIGNKPVALIETKHSYINDLDLNDNGIDGLRQLANLARLPLFVVVYYHPGENPISQVIDEFGAYWQFFVIPTNHYCYRYLNEPCHMTELEYVRLLYQLRNASLPGEVADRLHNQTTSLAKNKSIRLGQSL